MSYNNTSYTTRSRIYNFLETEFLNADKETLRLLVNYYYKKYGNGAGNYLVNTYYMWQKGYTGISSQTFGRIIEFMPKFLSDEKRFHILKEEIHTFFDSKRKDPKMESLDLQNINNSFSNIQATMLRFGKEDLHWFIGQNIFTEEQIEHYLKICRYVLNEQIIQSHRQVSNDLELIKGKLNNFDSIISSADYTITFFEKNLNVLDIKNIDFSFIPLKEINFELDESFKKFGEKYFLEELMKISFTEKNNKANALLKSNDIDIFFSHFSELKKQTDSQISMKSNYKGEGGTLSLNLEFIPYAISKRIMYFSSLKILSFFSIIVLIVMLIIMFPKYWIGISIISVIFGLNYLFPETIKEFKNFQIAKSQIKKYGKY